MEPIVGIELEAFLLEPDDEGGWRPIDTPGAYVYGTGMAVDPTGTIDESRGSARRMNVGRAEVRGSASRMGR